MRSVPTKIKFVVTLLSVVFALYFLAPIDASAHAYPDHADPKVGSSVTAPPARVRIWFDSALEPLFCTITVKDGEGKQVDKGDGGVDQSDPTLLQASLPLLPRGTYHVFWNVVARDTHRTSGTFTFTIK